MKVRLHSEEDLTLGDFDAPGLYVEVDEGVQAHYSALQMFAVSLGLCTASVLMAYGDMLQVPTQQLTVRLRWTVVEKPHRVEDIRMDIRWPELPESRLTAAERAAEQCTLHNTLLHPPRMVTTVTR
ncbi:MAG TPA: OsmC family protein [Myxococcaceae bacterium]|nr:OsmC family protein [Myxococcaceae bacterium]